MGSFAAFNPVPGLLGFDLREALGRAPCDSSERTLERRSLPDHPYKEGGSAQGSETNCFLRWATRRFLARDALHNSCEAVVVRIGMDYKAFFLPIARLLARKTTP